MTRKIVVGVTGIVLLVSAAVFAAEKAKEKNQAEKPEQKAKTCEMQKHPENLLDQLISAYKANDKEKMGEIIKKMEQRRDKMRKLAKLSRWHRWEHRRMERQGRGRGMGRGMNRGMRQGFAPGRQGCCPMGMRNRQGPGFNGCPMQGGRRGFGQRQGWMPQAPEGIDEPQAGDFEPQDMMEQDLSPETDLPDLSVADLFSETDW